MFLLSLACNVDFGPKSIFWIGLIQVQCACIPCNVECDPKANFRSELIKVRYSCIPLLVMWILAKNQFLGANCLMFLHSLHVIMNLAQNKFSGASCLMFLHSLACNVKFGPKSIFRRELFIVPAFLGL